MSRRRHHRGSAGCGHTTTAMRPPPPRPEASTHSPQTVKIGWLLLNGGAGRLVSFGVRYGTGMVWYGLSTVWYGMLQYDMVRYGTIQYDMVRYDIIRFGTIRHDTLWYGTVRKREERVECFLRHDGILCRRRDWCLGRYWQEVIEARVL